MNELDYSDYVNIKIIKVQFMEAPSCWAIEVTGKDGEEWGSGTSPTFAGAYDMGYSIVAGGDKHSNWEVNDWIYFDGNAKNWN